MRKILGILVLICVAAPVYAQRLTLDIPALGDRARESVDVTLDGPLLKLAAKFLSTDDPDERAARDIVSKIQGIYVKSYSFDKEGEYDAAIVDRLRAQLTNWKRIVQVKERGRESNEIYVDMRGEEVHGICVINAEPRELTVVNIVGPVDLDKLSKLEGQFGIPRMNGRKHRDRD